MTVKHVLLSSAALLMSASVAFAAYDPAAESREREITRQLNQQQAREAQSALERYEQSMQGRATDDARAQMDETLKSSATPTEIMPDTYSSNGATDYFDDDDTDTLGSSVENSDYYAAADGSRSSRTDSGYMSDSRDMVTRQATDEETDMASDSRVTTPENYADDELDVRGTGIGLQEVVRPQATLRDVKVETSDGEAVGEVQTVILGDAGTPSRLIIDAESLLGDAEPIEIDASQFVYDPDRNVLVTDLTANEIQNMAFAE
jgi:hypothetical protein